MSQPNSYTLIGQHGINKSRPLVAKAVIVIAPAGGGQQNIQ